MLERWTRAVIRLRWVVLAAWLVVFFVSGIAMAGLSDLLTNRFSLPGTDTARAERILEDQFNQRSTGSFTLVVQAQDGTSGTELVGAATAAAKRAAAKLPTAELADVRVVGEGLVSATIVSKQEPAEAKLHTDEMREAVGVIRARTPI